MLRSTRLAFVGVAASTALLWAAPPASQALLVYTATGPNISGSLGGFSAHHHSGFGEPTTKR